MEQDVESLVTGLSNGITKYLDLGSQYQLDAMKQQNANKAALNLKVAESSLDLEKGKQLEQYKVSLENLKDREQGVTLKDLAGMPEFATFAKLAPDTLLKGKDVLEYIKDREKAKQEKQPKEFQFKAANFFRRADQATKDLDNLESDGYDPASIAQQALNAKTPSVLQGSKWKRFIQSRDNFINAYLRRDSGAAIAASEYENADRQFFQMPGDDKGVLAQKTANRRNVLESLKAEAEGKAVDLNTTYTTLPGGGNKTGGQTSKGTKYRVIQQ